MKSFSYWESRYFWQPSDYLIAGGGITGLTTAIFLKKAQPSKRVVLLERGALPAGASTKNAGFACFGSMSEILDDLQRHSEAEVFALIARRVQGFELLRKLLSDDQLGYEHCGGFEVFLEGEEPLHKACTEAMGYVNEQLSKAIGTQPFREISNDIPATGMHSVRHMLLNAEEGLIQTGLMMHNMAALARALGVEIFTGMEVLSVEADAQGMRALTPQAELRAEQVCVATNGFAARLLPTLDVQPCRAQVLLTTPIEGLRIHGAFHHHYGFDYFRHVHGRILLGGGRHLDKAGEQTAEFGTTDQIQTYLEKFLREVIAPDHQFEIDMRWSGIMGMGERKDVIVQRIAPGLCCAVRFGGMGVSLGTAAGMEAANLLMAGT